MVIALFGIALIWVVFGRLDIVAAAEGRLVPQGFLKIVQPAVGGVVRDILVREGQTVRAGEVLMRMDTTLAAADVQALQTEYGLRDLTLRRIDAELADAPLTMREGDRPDLYAQIEAQHRARRQAYQDALAQETALLAKAKADVASARELQTKLAETLPSYRRSADAYEKLGRDGYAGSIVVQEKVRERIEKERDLKAQAAAVEALQATIAQSDRRLAQITSNYRADLLKERVETEARRERLKQELEKEQHKASLLELKAPQAGTVKELATHTRGTVVSPGTVLMTLVPQDEPLQAQVMVRNDDAGFVHEGQRVKLKLAAYPFQKYGMVEGTVLHLGADAIDMQPAQAGDRPAARPAQGYKAIVALDSQVLERDGAKLRLAPGMQVVAEIHQGKRSVLEYLLSPAQRAFHEAGRER
jgi:HlyD family secretion protein